MRKLTLRAIAVGGVLALAIALFADRPGRRNAAPDNTSQSDPFEEFDAHIEQSSAYEYWRGLHLAYFDYLQHVS